MPIRKTKRVEDSPEAECEAVGPTMSVWDLMEHTLIGHGRLSLGRVIDELSAHSLSKQLTCLSIVNPKSTIYLDIDCPGGDVYSGFAMINAIQDAQKRGVKIIGRVVGLAASMAIPILQACDKRVACKYSRLMIHEVSEFKAFSSETASEAEEKTQELKTVNELLAEMIAERAGKTTQEILKKIRKTDVWMSPKEALEYGLVDVVEGTEPEKKVADEPKSKKVESRRGNLKLKKSKKRSKR